jgi:hypothetical protein
MSPTVLALFAPATPLDHVLTTVMATEGTTADTPRERLGQLLDQLDELAYGRPDLERFATQLRAELERHAADLAMIDQWCNTIATVCAGASDALQRRDWRTANVA